MVMAAVRAVAVVTVAVAMLAVLAVASAVLVATMVSSAFHPLPVGFQAMGWLWAIRRVEPWLAGQSRGRKPVGPPW